MPAGAGARCALVFLAGGTTRELRGEYGVKPMSIGIETRLDAAEARPFAASPAAPGPATARRSASTAWWKRGLVAFGLLAVLVAGAAAVTHAIAPDDTKQLLTHRIQRGDLLVSVTEQGTVESSSNREIKCKVAGGTTLTSVIESGTEVKAGDELARLDTSKIDDAISQQKIACEKAAAEASTAEGELAFAKISITEYVEGKFKSELATKEKDLVVAESQLKSSQNSLDYFQRMFRKGYASGLEVASHEDKVKHAGLDVRAKQADLDALVRFGKIKTVQELESKVKTAEAKLASATAALQLEGARLERTQKQLENCVIRAEVDGMVMYPKQPVWRDEPDIKKGATVHEDQVLLIMPDMRQMEVKIGIHESKIDRVKVGLKARTELQGQTVHGEVTTVATMSKPTGWWAQNLVKYDTVVKLEEKPGLKPGMSTAVEIIIAQHEDVLSVPVAAVVEDDKVFWCWVQTKTGPVKRELKLGDSNDQFIVVESGLAEGEDVVLNPLDLLDEAQRDALETKQQEKEEEVKLDDAKAPAAAAGGG